MSTAMRLQQTNLFGVGHMQQKAVTPKNIVWLVLQILPHPHPPLSFILTMQSSFTKFTEPKNWFLISERFAQNKNTQF